MKTSIIELVLIFLLIMSYPIKADKLKFAVVPKSKASFFDQIGAGCREAAAEIEADCLFYPGTKNSDIRVQNKIIKNFIDEGVDGIAIAFLQSDRLAIENLQEAQKAGIPIVTIDSDLDTHTLKKYKKLRAAFIGTNNFEFGKMLGEQVKKLRPKGGKLCIQTGHQNSPNLNLRVMGVRSALSGKNYALSPGKKLKNINGWTEVPRCPLHHNDQGDRSLKQMEVMLGKAPNEIDTFVSVNFWPQAVPSDYRRMIQPFKKKIEQMEVVLVFGDTLEGQLELLKDHLSHVNIGQVPYEMGRQAIFTLHKIVKGEDYQEMNYTPLTYCTPKNYDTCTKSSNVIWRSETEQH